MWKKVHGYVTPGGDPVWACGECGGDQHVYGVEHQKNYHRACAECGRPQLYPWESGRKFLYYLLMRPVGPGCQPPGSVDWGNMDGETVLPEIGHHAWGWVEYDHLLTEKELRDYEMAEVPE